MSKSTGLIFVPNLKSGAWVIVEELKTLPSYRLDNLPRNVEIKGDRLNILEYRNQPYPNLLVKKVDADTGKALEGVKFKLYDKLNRELGVFTTSQLGQIHLTGMEAGTYYLQEVEARLGYYDSDDEDESNPHYRIHIDIWDIGAPALMKKCGFDDFKTEWAGFLYGNLMETQLLDPSVPGYDGDMPGVDLGDITFTNGATSVVYYNQMDSDWCNEAYGKTQTIGVAGCGPTALAIVVSSLTETKMNPKEMADWAYEHGYCCEGDGSYRTLIPEGAAAFGLSVTGAGRGDAQAIVDALSAGKLVVAIMGPGHFTTAGHFIVLRGVTAEGKFLVADPVSYGKSQREWDASIVMNEASRSNAANGPFWIVGS